MAIGKYRMQHLGGFFIGGTPPEPQTFEQLGIVSARIVSAAGGADYAELTRDTPLAEGGLPFAPLSRHIIYRPDGSVCFVGVLTQPSRQADGSAQRQTFRLEGPSYFLECYPYLQPWAFATAPGTFGGGSLEPKMISRFILHRDADGKINLRQQVQAIVNYAIDRGAMINLGEVTAIPAVTPPEDEQTDQTCGQALSRVLRWVPGLTARWLYGGAQPTVPTLVFSNDDTAATTTIVTNDGSLNMLRNDPRYDLLLKKLTVHYVSESHVEEAGERRIWAVVDTEESDADNGATREAVYLYDLRGQSVQTDGDGSPLEPQEDLPTGLAAVLHGPFKKLYNSLQWATTGEDVDWSASVGMLVDPQTVNVSSAGSPGLSLISYGVTARSAIQQITRDLATGTTTFTAGPPAQLGFADMLALRIAGSASRNSARNRGSQAGGGYTAGFGGPETKKKGEKPVTGGGGGTALPARQWNVAVNGQPAYCDFSSGLPQSTPTGTEGPVNPP